jgi:hypothetical protein
MGTESTVSCPRCSFTFNADIAIGRYWTWPAREEAMSKCPRCIDIESKIGPDGINWVQDLITAAVNNHLDNERHYR